MSEEKFFQQVKSGLYDYAPEVPSGVYSGMRRKLWMSNFLTWNWSSLNVWYVTFMIAASASFMLFNNEPQLKADKAIALPVHSSEIMMSAASHQAAQIDEPVVVANTIASKAKRSSRNFGTNLLQGISENVGTAGAPDVSIPDCTLPIPDETELTTTVESSETNETVAPKEEPKKRTLEIDVYVGEK